MAAAVSVYGGHPEYRLEPLRSLTAAQINQAQEMVNQGTINITPLNTADFIHIDLTVTRPTIAVAQ
ncbi:hypothetical protein HQN64_23960 [Enterobacteriaceae bacterium BIT-l23]|uniref:hypothetical protein n=1 Tax=Jejubacter sp. L23 TaxID=3092086 RepID=UPI001585A718|nr:hypothetical protein [Enterobacteriaceae bacterium BIT-l23]